MAQLDLPNGAFITNRYDNVSRLLWTKLLNSSSTALDSQVYGNNLAGQRTSETNLPGDFRLYTYDNSGELLTANGQEAGGTVNRLNEQFGYGYDPVGNLSARTNNELVQSFTVNNANELSSASRNTNMTVIGTSSSQASSVTVNGISASLYGDYTFAATNMPLVDGNNTFTAIAHDSYGRWSTNTSMCYLPASVTYSYDQNGNLLSDGTRNFAYDDENQLVAVWVTNVWESKFIYDGKMRRRVRQEYAWPMGGTNWVETNEVRYIYDGMVPIQERDINNLPLTTHTHGNDLSGSLQGAGGIGGLLARTDNQQLIAGIWTAHTYYHSDGNGNVTCLINSNQTVAAKYEYDPFGNILSLSGQLASANLYCFSSKEYHLNSGLVYYGYRFCDVSLQRWVNRDPRDDLGFESLRVSKSLLVVLHGDPNAYGFVRNDPLLKVDTLGLNPVAIVACSICAACLIDVSADCSILCRGGTWDQKGEGFGSCFKKCVAAAVNLPGLTTTCASACTLCLLKVPCPEPPPPTRPSVPPIPPRNLPPANYPPPK